ncbi:GspH/FimT family protein [Steroidobacter sp.]|uniref:GspH/FimT family protein n=1 Tax=Steroidobacter sp. TaxID=1978227 RepID=UPI001A516FB6|nr:GspH/FimT family pseudopilin [Steroidobacter sp.]MBL8268704.1 GspH/FimT family pseudopilin [Steroidobacter sp.]
MHGSYSYSTRSGGLTLLELLVTLTVAGVLLGLAVPGFTNLWLDSQRTVAVNGLVHDIFLARHATVSHGRPASICASRDGLTCTNQTSDWQLGWMVFLNLDQDDPPVRDDNEPILAVQAAWRGGSITSNRRSYSFRPIYNGVINGTVVFCDRRGSEHARAIVINNAGRPRIATRDSDDRPLRCPFG